MLGATPRPAPSPPKKSSVSAFCAAIQARVSAESMSFNQRNGVVTARPKKSLDLVVGARGGMAEACWAQGSRQAAPLLLIAVAPRARRRLEPGHQLRAGEDLRARAFELVGDLLVAAAQALARNPSVIAQNEALFSRR